MEMSIVVTLVVSMIWYDSFTLPRLYVFTVFEHYYSFYVSLCQFLTYSYVQKRFMVFQREYAISA